jgi:diacylglycerol kinase family enzyme
LLPRTWHERTAETFRVGGPRGRLRAAVDGEPVELDAPIELRIAPRALHVLLPRQGQP